MLKIDSNNLDVISKVLNDGIWYYNMLGKVGHLCLPSIDIMNITGKKGQKNLSFKWSDLNIKFWLTKEEAEFEAKKYLDEVLKYVNKATLNKITKLKNGDTFYYIFNNEVYDEKLEYSHYDKFKKALIVVNEYDDDYGFKYDEREYPISKYGETWALTEKELKGKRN